MILSDSKEPTVKIRNNITVGKTAYLIDYFLANNEHTGNRFFSLVKSNKAILETTATHFYEISVSFSTTSSQEMMQDISYYF